MGFSPCNSLFPLRGIDRNSDFKQVDQKFRGEKKFSTQIFRDGSAFGNRVFPLSRCGFSDLPIFDASHVKLTLLNLLKIS